MHQATRLLVHVVMMLLLMNLIYGMIIFKKIGKLTAFLRAKKLLDGSTWIIQLDQRPGKNSTDLDFIWLLKILMLNFNKS